MSDSNRLAVLERSRGRWRMIATGVIGLGAGAMLAGAMQDVPVPAEVVSVVLEPTRSSGRWNSTLLAVKDNGEIVYLDTSRPKTQWVPFEFSPSFSPR